MIAYLALVAYKVLDLVEMCVQQGWGTTLRLITLVIVIALVGTAGIHIARM